MLRSQFGGAGGNLYKPDGPGADWTRFDEAGFAKKTNMNSPDFTDVAEAIAALHAEGPSPEWRANLERRLDVDHFLRWLAVNQVVDNWDTYGRFAHNYYLYADPARGGRLVWIPWDNLLLVRRRRFVRIMPFRGAPRTPGGPSGRPRSSRCPKTRVVGYHFPAAPDAQVKERIHGVYAECQRTNAHGGRARRNAPAVGAA